MLEAIITGVLLGLGLAILLGPVFFALIQTSINKGFRPAVYMAAGISVGDAIYIALFLVGVDLLPDRTKLEMGLSVGGGVLLVVMGIGNIIRKPKTPVEKRELPSLTARENRHLFYRGIAVNALSPSVLLFWLATVGNVTTLFSKKWQEVLCFAATVTTVFVTDLGKAYFAKVLRNYLTTKRLLWLNRVVGVLLIIFGCRLLWYGLRAWLK